MRQETFVDDCWIGERFPVYGTLWGRVDSPWMFSIQADARENRDALLAAFVLRPSLHRDSSPSRYPAVNVLGSPRGGASRLKKRARQVSNLRPPA